MILHLHEGLPQLMQTPLPHPHSGYRSRLFGVHFDPARRHLPVLLLGIETLGRIKEFFEWSFLAYF
jgi:hypothetical protein